jgi:DNA invertase Pin-like site-specific DNA recombinase
MFPKVFTNPMKTAPERYLRGPFHLVALEQFCSNTTIERSAHNVPDETTVQSVPEVRRRVTGSLRADVVEHYTQGMTARQVASTVGLGRTTVLKIPKEAGVAVRPQGRRY